MIVKQICPHCETEIGAKPLSTRCIQIGWDEGYRRSKCECGEWETEHNLTYTGENSIYTSKQPYVIYRPFKKDTE